MLEDKLTVMRKHHGTDDINEYRKLQPGPWEDGPQDIRPLEEVIKMPWPYYAQDSSLPDISTAADVENASRDDYYDYPFSDACDWNHNHVYRVKGVYAVKVSRHLKLAPLFDVMEMRALQRLLRPGKSDEDFTPKQKLFASIFLDTLNNFARGGEPRLCQGDNAFHNFRLVRPKSNPESDDFGDYDVCMIDFEHMAWLPAWAEIVTMIGTTFGFLLQRDEGRNLELILSKAFEPYYRCIATFYRECYKAIVSSDIPIA
ncbi:MAG: hypothetical protein Q9227_007252 [Pyrenula ochraceoflavens]